MLDYWQQIQPTDQPFPDLIWNRPEQKQQAGTITIVGGSSGSFLAVSKAEQACLKLGVGEAKLILPDSLTKLLPSGPQINFVDSNPSGGMAKKALPKLIAAAEASDACLLIGDLGKNPETAALLETFVNDVFADDTQLNQPLILARDAVDAAIDATHVLVQQKNVLLIISFTQLQKTFRQVLYPVVLTFAMPINKIVEALHKFTITYPLTLALFHQNQFLIAQDGKIISLPFNQAMAIWQGEIPAEIACWAMWSPNQLLEASATALTKTEK